MGADGEKIESCSSDWVMTEAEEDLDTWGGCHAVFLVPSYLAHLTSWETVFVDIPATYYDLGFWGAAHRRCSRQSFPPDVLQGPSHRRSPAAARRSEGTQ